jgi:hypothetical protein
MKISMHAATIELFVPMLTSLSALLDKAAAHAEAKKFDPAVLLAARLYPDMLPLSRQVQLAADFAKNSTARLAGMDAPKFADDESTIAELKVRLQRTIDYLQGVGAAALDGAEQREIKVPLRNRTLEMQGLPFLQKWVLPNFYFHVTTAYAILRHNGVEVGKADFLGSV